MALATATIYKNMSLSKQQIQDAYNAVYATDNAATKLFGELSQEEKIEAILSISTDSTSGSTGTVSFVMLQDAVTTLTGAAVDFTYCYSKFVVQLKLNSGSLSAITCNIQASLTGNEWQTIATFTDTTDGGILFIIDRPTIKLRANLTTLTGVSPNISLYCAGVA